MKKPFSLKTSLFSFLLISLIAFVSLTSSAWPWDKRCCEPEPVCCDPCQRVERADKKVKKEVVTEEVIVEEKIQEKIEEPRVNDEVVTEEVKEDLVIQERKQEEVVQEEVVTTKEVETKSTNYFPGLY